MLTTHPLLVPRLRKCRSYTSCHPNAPLWSVTGPLYLFTVVLMVYIKFWNTLMPSYILKLYFQNVSDFLWTLSPEVSLRFFGSLSSSTEFHTISHFLQFIYFSVSDISISAQTRTNVSSLVCKSYIAVRLSVDFHFTEQYAVVMTLPSSPPNTPESNPGRLYKWVSSRPLSVSSETV
jgi:hypothetical protein